MSAEIYQWVDEDGLVHYGDSDSKPDDAQKTELGPVNTVEAPTPIPQQSSPQPAPEPQKPPTPVMTASNWAAEHCQTRTRILYTERPFIPCAPTDEVTVYLCTREPPRKFRNYFGRQYRYQDRESECGPEVYEGEILYIKK